MTPQDRKRGGIFYAHTNLVETELLIGRAESFLYTERYFRKSLLEIGMEGHLVPTVVLFEEQEAVAAEELVLQVMEEQYTKLDSDSGQWFSIGNDRRMEVQELIEMCTRGMYRKMLWNRDNRHLKKGPAHKFYGKTEAGS